MSATVVRRVRLPADRRTPGAAREIVRAALAEAELTEVMNEALLLTTELTTNGVVHAGTDIDLEVVADREELTVTVWLAGMTTSSPEPGTALPLQLPAVFQLPLLPPVHVTVLADV